MKNLKQDGTVQQYQDAYSVLLTKVDLTEAQAMSFYLGGIQSEIEMAIRMFNPQSLVWLMCTHCQDYRKLLSMLVKEDSSLFYLLL